MSKRKDFLGIAVNAIACALTMATLSAIAVDAMTEDPNNFVLVDRNDYVANASNCKANEICSFRSTTQLQLN